MTDLTVLVSPLPLYPEPPSLPFVRRTRPATRPIMVTLESATDDPDLENSPYLVVASSASASTSALGSGSTLRASPNQDPDFIHPPVASPPRRARTPRVVEPHLLSPPINTWKARPRPRHRPTRSHSAPPERRTPSPDPTIALGDEANTPLDAGPSSSRDPRQINSLNGQGETRLPLQSEALGFRPRPRPPVRSTTALGAAERHALASTSGGELVKPPPPLLRPTTFWRKTRRSGVTGPSYSPSSHLIRRSTYIAAGLPFDAPIHDLSALCVESRVGFIVVPPIDQSMF